MKKIWLPTAFTGIEKVEEYLAKINLNLSPTDQILLDYPLAESRELKHFLEKAQEYRGLVVPLNFEMNAQVIEQIKHLEAISNYAVGYNNIDLAALKRIKIPYGYTPDVLNESTADTALTLTLMCARRIHFAMEDVKNGRWKKFELSRYNGFDPRNLKIGIIGLGRIGETFARKCYQLWQNPIYTLKHRTQKTCDFPIQYVDEETFFREVNLLSLHCPLNDETRGMIDKEYIDRFKQPFIFINTARGPLHCEKDLLWGLETGRIHSIGLDVTEVEPIDAQHPLLKRDSENRVVILPHIGSATDQTRSDMTFRALNNVIEVMLGRPMPFPLP